MPAASSSCSSASSSALVALGILFAGPIVALFANGFKATPGKFELTVRLTRWMFPYVLLVSAAALLEAYLNAKGFFQLSAATPIAWNLAIVAAAWALAPAGVSPLAALTVGVLVGGFLQVALQGPAVRRLGLRFSGSPFRDKEVKRTALQIAPRLYGYGVGQLSFLVSTRTLAALGDAFVTYNFCAWRVTDFVLGGFVVSITRAILPSLSDQALEKDRTAYRGTIAFALRLIGFITIPSTVGLWLLATPLIDVVFRRGRFGAADVDMTALAVGLLRARPLRGCGREGPHAGVLRAPRHPHAGLRGHVRPRRVLGALRRARGADAPRGGRARDGGGLLDQLPRASRRC